MILIGQSDESAHYDKDAAFGTSPCYCLRTEGNLDGAEVRGYKPEGGPEELMLSLF